MRIAITGSIATDHLMTFPGKFTDQLVADKLDKVALSFLVDELQIRRGGVAANIAFGMACLGVRPLLIGSVGPDFAEYRGWLDRHGVDTSGVRESVLRHTARFVATTDLVGNQIASFYAGAMSDARFIELRPVAARVGGLDLVVISPNDPEAMLRHTDECRSRGYRFVADPSQQLTRMDGPEIRRLIEGAAFLFTNEYEKSMTETKTGWSDAEVLARVEVRVTTLGPRGAIIERAGQPPITVAAVPERGLADPTGVGDGFRAGFFAGLAWGLGLERCAQIGSLLATYVLETVGPQEYEVKPGAFYDRFAETFGDDAAAEIGHLVDAGLNS